MRILIIEDDKETQEYYVRGIERKGVDYDLVDSRIEALNKLKNRSYEGAIVDLQLTDDQSYSPGIEVLKYIEAANEGTKAIVVSGTPHPQNIIDSYDSGAIRAIAKGNKSFREIAEMFVDECKNVKIRHFGRFPSLNAYLASPDKSSVFWEDSLNKILQCGYEKLNKTLYNAFKNYLPVLRPIESAQSFQMDISNGVVFGSFWSKGQGFPFFIAIMKSNNKVSEEVFLPNGVTLIHEIQPVKEVTVKLWRLTDVGRGKFYEFINNIGL